VWTDAHCHLTGAELDEARAAGVTRFVSVGTDLATSGAAIALAAEHDDVWATAGVHPHDAEGGIAGLEALLGEVVAVGECGLDFHYDHSPRDAQRSAFAAQIALAHEHDLALVVHTREAWDDTFAILAAEGVPERTMFHCFTGGPAEAERCLSLGATLSFSGIVTFKTAGDLREAAVLCPLDRMTVETDSPYLAPVPHRGQPNRPAWVPLVGAAIAELKGVAVDDLARATTANAERLLRLRSGYGHP
jgi:TatD DNase family protein